MTCRRALVFLAIAVALLGRAATAAADPADAVRASPGAVAAEPSSGCHAGDSTALTGERRTLTVKSDTRSYLIDAPAGGADRPLPVVLVFHGFRGNAAMQRDGTTFTTLAQRERFIVIHPDGHEGVRLLGTIGRGWDLGEHDTRDLEFVRALLDRIESERCVDRRRIYATGMSNGGFFSNLLGCRLPERIAAIAPVAGAMPLPACSPSLPVAVLLIFGRADDIVPPVLARGARDWWAQAQHCRGSAEQDGCVRYDGCSADLVYCEGPQAHAWPRDATERIWRFFTSHVQSSSRRS